jgi:hypothetical protein
VPVVSAQNFDGAWEYTFATNTSQAYALGTDQEPFYTAYYLNIQGNVVPEPATMFVILGAAVTLLSRRRLSV